MALCLTALLLSGCLSLSVGDQFRLEALRWAKANGGTDVRIVWATEVNRDLARRSCGRLRADLPQKLGGVRMVGRFPGGDSAFVLVVRHGGAVYVAVPAPEKTCVPPPG